jgi:cytochrome oxidase Cu insertion factor (SCO1/SenC/PrrC family)
VALLSACADTSTALVEVHGSAPAQGALQDTEIGDVITRPALVLRDTTGAVFDPRSRPASELTVIFFGYTRCPTSIRPR